MIAEEDGRKGEESALPERRRVGPIASPGIVVDEQHDLRYHRCPQNP